MLFSNKRPQRSDYFRRQDEEDEEEPDERRERIKFRSYLSHRSTGRRSMLWLLIMFLAVLAVFIYLSI